MLARGEPRQALQIARDHQPELMILGLQDADVLVAAISAIASQLPTVKTIVYAGSPTVEHAVRALEAGAKGYALKSGGVEEILLALDCVHKDEIYISRSFASGVISALSNEFTRKATLRKLKLNIREHQIVHLLLRGATNKEIASHLTISEKTVKHYMTSLMNKLSVRNRTEVVLAAQQFIGAQQQPNSLFAN